MKKIFLSLITILTCNLVDAQSRKGCANMRVDTLAMLTAETFALQRVPEVAPQAVSRLIKVYFHICRNNSGLAAAATLEEVEAEFNMLVSKFAANNLCFANMGINFIDNSIIDFNINPDVSADVDLLTT